MYCSFQRSLVFLYPSKVILAVQDILQGKVHAWIEKQASFRIMQCISNNHKQLNIIKQLLLTQLASFSNVNLWWCIPSNKACIDPIMLVKIIKRKLSLSYFVNPEAWINLICLMMVDFPESPAPFFFFTSLILSYILL